VIFVRGKIPTQWAWIRNIFVYAILSWFLSYLIRYFVCGIEQFLASINRNDMLMKCNFYCVLSLCKIFRIWIGTEDWAYRTRICIASFCCEEPNPDLAYRCKSSGNSLPGNQIAPCCYADVFSLLLRFVINTWNHRIHSLASYFCDRLYKQEGYW
jgi:hypothetical protein